MSPITIILIVIVAFLAGMEGILDEFEFHQPLVACTLIGLVSGHLQEGILLGGQLQMIALGWANIGAAVAPDAALASVASAIIMVLALNGGNADASNAITTSVALAIPLSVAGLFLTMICRTLATGIVHAMDACAEKGDFKGIEVWQIVAICMQGVRIAIPAALLCVIPAEAVTNALNAMPAWLSGGMAVGGGMYWLGVSATVLTLAGLELLTVLFKNLGLRTMLVHFTTTRQENLVRILDQVHQRRYRVVSYKAAEEKHGELCSYRVSLVVKIKEQREEQALFTFIQSLPDLVLTEME